MKSVKNMISKITAQSKIFVYLGITLLFISSFYLRFINLGYSEFQDDEKKTRILTDENTSVLDFFLSQRKGPMQFLVAYIPLTYFKDGIYVNEFAVRLPFTIAGFISIFVLYGLIFKLTKSHLASFFVAILYSFNGFVVGFSRIAQYQNLNLLFSFLSLYFFSNLILQKDRFRWSSFFGSLFISLSILSHWDAIFYSVPLLYFTIVFLFRKDVSKNEKIINIVIWLIPLLTLVLPFMIGYLTRLTSTSSENSSYLFKRVGIAGSDLLRHKVIFELYNPQITLWLYFAGIVLALPFIKKMWMFVLWFLVDLLLIKFFMITPKTHIYNYVIPALITSGLSFYYFNNYLLSKLKEWAYIFTLLFVSVGILLFIQSYQIFVDHSKEYPFDEKKILWHLNPVLYDEEVITFGFPHNRNWKEVDKYIDPNCNYISNEAKGISQIYVRASWGRNDTCFYIVTVRRPFNVDTKDVKFSGTTDSKLVYKYIKDGETLTKVYKLK